MPMYDLASTDTSSLAYGLDTQAALGGDDSLFSSIKNVITKGVPLTGLAVVNSFANTAVKVDNWFGGDATPFTVKGEVSDLGLPDDYNDYYQQHQFGIETAAMLAGSVIPGMAAIKALKLAQAGEFGSVLARATGIFSAPKQAVVDGALQEINAGSGALYGSLNADKLKAIAYGFGDQALQAVAYQTATVATMKGSPLLDKDGLSDITDNMFWGTLLGAGVGGLLDGVGVNALLNKAKFNADLATKNQELSTRLGIGNYPAGDRVVALLDSLDKVPEPTNVLGKKKLSALMDSAMLEAHKQLLPLVQDGDNEVSNAVLDALLKTRDDALADINNIVRPDPADADSVTAAKQQVRETVYNYLARLAKISRLNQTPEIDDSSSFYINRFSKKNNYQPQWSDLVTSVPHPNADLSLRYRLVDPTIRPNIASFDNKISWEGREAQLYPTAQDAWNNGADIYIDRGGIIRVNNNFENIERVARPGEGRVLSPKEEITYRKTGQLPEGSQPLYGAPLVLNVLNGAIRVDALPVVGDIGKVSLFDKGLQYGDRTSLQAISAPLTKETPAIDANARYVWANLRGIKAGDEINPTDIPLLEQLYREGTANSKGWQDYIETLNRKKVTFTDGSSLPASADDLLSKIRGAKDDLIHDIIQGDPKVSSEEVAQRANVPEDYIANGFKATDPNEYMINPTQHAQVNNVKLWYDIGNVYQQDGMILKGMLDHQYRINLGKQAAQTGTARFFGKNWQQFIIDAKSSDADILGVGNKFLTSSNSNYDTLGQEAERVGRVLSALRTERMSAISETLSASVQAIRNDEIASAELGMFRAVRLRTGKKFTFLPDDLMDKYFPYLDKDKIGIAVLQDSLKKDKTGNIVDWDKKYLPEGFLNGESDWALNPGAKGNYNFYQLSEKVTAFERANQQVNDTRVIDRNNWYAAQGMSRYIEPGTLYTPPIDTGKYPHFALIKVRPGTGMADDGVGIITANTSGELEQKIASLGDEFSVYTKDMIKDYHEVMGDYEYDRNFNDNYVNSTLARRGILNNVFPDTRAETIIKDYLDWHTRQDIRLLRDHVELGNAQLFAELRAMGQRFTASETSQTGFVSKFLGRSVANPYDSYIKTSLGISQKENYRLWQDANEKVEAFFDTAFRTAKQAFFAAKGGLATFEQASKAAEAFGLGNPYGAATDAVKAYSDIANKLPPERYLTKFVAVANSVLGASVIRLDTWQQLVHIVSTPILLSAEASSLKNGALKDLLTTELPDGSGRRIPATSKLLYNAIQNWFNPATRQAWMPKFQELKIIRTPGFEQRYFNMIDELTLPYGTFSENGFQQKLHRMVDAGAKVMGTNFSENFTGWMAADVGRQLFEAAGYEGKQLTDNIATFVNRVKGNLVASQRPIAFQGPLGMAVGLFQSYQFNMFQQLFRYIENGEARSLATLAGLQTTFFGMNSLPGFQMINQHLIGNSANNPNHLDLYNAFTGSNGFFGKKLGDYIMYGALSNFTGAGLYTRGDMNPRRISLLPVNPLEYPFVSATIRFFGNLLDTAKKIAEGGSIPSSLLLGLEHNGLSRPLSGLAQMIQGYSTSSTGQLISQARPGMGDNSAGWSDWFSMANFSRLLGARPLDEAVALDAKYRMTAYQAKSNKDIEALGEAAKTKMYGNQNLSPEDIQNFASQYAQSGGDMRTFGKKILQWTQNANTSVANEVFRSLRHPMSQNAMMLMGGQPLPDFSGPGSTMLESSPTTSSQEGNQ